MSQVLVGGFLVVHGLITTFIGFGAATNPNASAMALPSWFGWWPGPFGTSWLVEALDLGTPVAVLGGLIWLASGLALVGGGLGWIGISYLVEMKYALLVSGAGLGVVAMALYFHPIYLAAVLINVAIIALSWGRLTTAS